MYNQFKSITQAMASTLSAGELAVYPDESPGSDEARRLWFVAKVVEHADEIELSELGGFTTRTNALLFARSYVQSGWEIDSPLMQIARQILSDTRTSLSEADREYMHSAIEWQEAVYHQNGYVKREVA